MSIVDTLPERSNIVVFELNGQRHALPLAAVERVIHAVEVTPLPGAPACVLGIIDVAGEVLAVYCTRPHADTSPRSLELTDQLLIVRTTRRAIALVVGAVQEVREWDGRLADAGGLPQIAGSVRAICRLDGDLVLVQDVERFLSDAQECALAAAMEGVNERR